MLKAGALSLQGDLATKNTPALPFFVGIQASITQARLAHAGVTPDLRIGLPALQPSLLINTLTLRGKSAVDHRL